jgi:tryptophan 7-halogenase
MKIKNIVVVGGGAEVWVAAAALANGLVKQPVAIHVIETPQTTFAGYADACLPSIRAFHQILKINEREFMAKTRATFKLATHYVDWAFARQSFMHASTAYGNIMNGIDFQQYANLLHACGDSTPFDAYSFAAQAAHHHKFTLLTSEQQSQGLNLDYGIQVDVESYKHVMKSYACNKGVTWVQGDITLVKSHNDDGNITSVLLKDGVEIRGDFFIDAGDPSSALSQMLDKDAYEDYANRLLVDKRLDAMTAATEPPMPAAELKPHGYGWKKTIPLQNQQSSTYFYSSRYLSDQEALQDFQQQVNVATEIKLSTIRHGKRKLFWEKNYLALGMAAGNLGHLALSHFHLVQSGILRFIELFPAGDIAKELVNEYNALTTAEYERVLDFHQLHLQLAAKNTALNISPFWRDAQQMTISQELEHKIRLFMARGKVAFHEHETWSPPLWVAFFLGHNQWPQKQDPLMTTDIAEVSQALNNIKNRFLQYADAMLAHAQFIERYCPAVVENKT